MRKATLAERKSGSERFIAICVSGLKSLPELYVGYSHHETGEIRRTAANVHLVHQYTCRRHSVFRLYMRERVYDHILKVCQLYFYV